MYDPILHKIKNLKINAQLWTKRKRKIYFLIDKKDKNILEKEDYMCHRILQILTRTLAANALEGPLSASVLRATSAAACSACLRVEQKLGLSKVSPLKFTVALNRGA